MTAPVILVVGSGRGALEACREITAQGGRAVLARSGAAKRQCALRTPSGFEVMNAEILSVEGSPGRFQVTLLAGDDEVKVECSAIILAPGPEDRPAGEGTMTLDELERTGAPDSVRTAAFVLRPGTPRRSFIRAVRAARQLRSNSASVVLFADEMLAFGTDEVEYRQAQADGVVFVRTRKAEVTPGQRKVGAVDEVAGSLVEVAPDLLVVEAPSSELGNTVPVSPCFGVLRGNPGLGAVSTTAEGIFFVGREDEMLDSEAITAARAAAARAMTMARSPPDHTSLAAVVDRERCSACLTCFRVCPHGAARPAEEGKAIIDGGLCQACGICVSACPARALSLPLPGGAVSGSGAIPMEGHR